MAYIIGVSGETEPPSTVAELPTFTRNAAIVWTDEERTDFVSHIAYHPNDGDVIPDTGGLRKIRWGRKGMGKRGGIRVIYFFYDEGVPIMLITVYAKATAEDLSPEAKKVFVKLVDELKKSIRKKEKKP